MGAGEEGTPAKSSKPVSSTQEIPTTPSYPDWSNSMQAYYGAGATPPPFFASTVVPPTPHPYMWGGQHSLLTPYGTPVPYPALYSPGGVYAHHTMAMTTPNTVQVNTEPEKERNSGKICKGNGGSKGGESGKMTSGSGNDGGSQSRGESGSSQGSSDANDDNDTHQEYGTNKKGSFDQMLADANSRNITKNVQGSVPGNPVRSMPATNLNIGMEYWNPSPTAPGAAKRRSNQPGAPISSSNPDNWIQDERELKRQKRKQSNRESARRSRLRKQSECEELQVKVDNLNNENLNLKDELSRLSEECGKLTSENSKIKGELVRLGGPEALSILEHNNTSSHIHHQGCDGKM